jgi:hypothetical protein
MPWLEENGLLPGLGVPRMVLADFGSVGASSVTAGDGVADSVTGASIFGAGVGAAATSFTCSDGAGFSAVTLGLAGSFFAGLTALGKAARSLIATGGVIVEEPPLTYSPSSSNFANATLVSIPSSLAMSYTRGSATLFLLFGAYPNREGLSSELFSFRETHFVSAIFSA